MAVAIYVESPRYWWSSATRRQLDQRAKQMSTDDFRRVAWYGCLTAAGVRTWTKAKTKERLARGLPAGPGMDHYTSEPVS